MTQSQTFIGYFLNGLSQRKSVIWALINRDIAARFGKSYFGYVWIFLEPVLHIAMWVVIFGLIRKREVDEISIYLFLLTGIVPFLYLSKNLNKNVNNFKSMKPLLNYQPVKPIDGIVAKVIVESVISLILFVTGLFILLYINDPYIIYYPLRIIYVFAELALLTTGLSIFVAIAGFYYVDTSFILTILIRILYFTSGAILPIDIVPKAYQYYLAYNPLYQAISLIRSSFSYGPVPLNLSNHYLSMWALFSFVFSLILYFVSRHNMLMNARAR